MADRARKEVESPCLLGVAETTLEYVRPGGRVPHKEEITMMWWYGNGMSGWGYLVMTVSMVAFWGVLIAGGIAVFRSLTRSPANPGTAEARPTPERLLAERFAKGEIDEEEYRRRLDTLRGIGPVARS